MAGQANESVADVAYRQPYSRTAVFRHQPHISDINPSDIGVQAALLAAFIGHEAWGLKGWSEWVLPTE
jgi:hypothetical protein